MRAIQISQESRDAEKQGHGSGGLIRLCPFEDEMDDLQGGDRNVRDGKLDRVISEHTIPTPATSQSESERDNKRANSILMGI